jgi:hypothetical protein
MYKKNGRANPTALPLFYGSFFSRFSVLPGLIRFTISLVSIQQPKME